MKCHGPTAPSWITTTDSANPNDLWAPDISFYDGTANGDFRLGIRTIDWKMVDHF